MSSGLDSVSDATVSISYTKDGQNLGLSILEGDNGATVTLSMQ